jgi:hypothetical protein
MQGQHTESHTHRPILPVLAVADGLALFWFLLAVTDHGCTGAACLVGWPRPYEQQPFSMAVGACVLQMQRSTARTSPVS